MAPDAASAGSWQERVPTLFRDVVRFGVVAVGGLVIYSKVWGQDVGGALTALCQRCVDAVDPVKTRILVNDRLDVALAAGTMR